MSTKNLVIRSFTWAVVFTTLFVLTLGAVLIALIVGDWIWIHTHDQTLAWFVGIFTMSGFLITLGAGIGVFMWLRGPDQMIETRSRTDTMDMIIQDVTVLDRD